MVGWGKRRKRIQSIASFARLRAIGEVAERLIAPVLKTGKG